MATGSSHTYFNHPEWESFAPGLKTLEDAFEIRRRVLKAFEHAERETDDQKRQELLTFVLVGGGPTGVELAGTLAEIARQTLRDEFRAIDTTRARVVLVEAGPTILATFPETLRDAARRSLKRLGVEVMEATKVVGVDDHGAIIEPGGRVVSGTVLWTAGVAASPLVATLGAPLDRAGRVLVLPDLTIPDHREVFVVGDAAAAYEEGKLLPGVAQTAMQGAAYAARTILQRQEGGALGPFQYRDLGNMAIVGRNAAVADLNWARFSGFPAWLAWLFLHIFMLIGFRNRVGVMLAWAFSYLTFQRSARLITEKR